MASLIEKHIWEHADDVIGFYNNEKIDITSLEEMSRLGMAFFKKSDKIVNFKFSFDYINFFDKSDAQEKLRGIINEIQEIKSINTDIKRREKRILPNKDKELDFETREDIIILKKEYVKEKWNRSEKELVKYTYEKAYISYATLENCFFAIHTIGFDEKYSVKPHIHILFSKDKNHFGYGFKGLVKGIKEICKKHDLVSSIEKLESELEKNEEIELKNLNQRLSRFSWGVAKNPNFRGKEDGKYSINFKNIQEKVDRYIELGGCIAFCEKMKIRLKDRGIRLKINKHQTEISAERNLLEKKYVDIIFDVSNRAIQKKKIPEVYRNYAGYTNNENNTKKEGILKIAIKSLFLKSINELNDSSKNIAEIKIITEKYIKAIKELEKKELEEKLEKEYIEKLESSGYINYLVKEIISKEFQNGKHVEKNYVNEVKMEIKEVIMDNKNCNYCEGMHYKEKILKYNYFIYRIVFKEYFNFFPKIDVDKLLEIDGYTGKILEQYAEKLIISELKQKKYISESELRKDYKLINGRLEKREDTNLYIFKSDVQRILNIDIAKYFEENLYEKIEEIITVGVKSLDTNRMIEEKIENLGVLKCRDDLGRKTNEYKSILTIMYEKNPKLKRTPLYLIKNATFRKKIEEIYYQISENYFNCYFDIENNSYIEEICEYVNKNIIDISDENYLEIVIKICEIMEIDINFESDNIEEILQNMTEIEKNEYEEEIK